MVRGTKMVTSRFELKDIPEGLMARGVYDQQAREHDLGLGKLWTMETNAQTVSTTCIRQQECLRWYVQLSPTSFTILVCSRMASSGTKVAPICCVMPPASPSCTCVRRILSRILVLPVSTCPKTHTTGERRRSAERSSLCLLRRF